MIFGISTTCACFLLPILAHFEEEKKLYPIKRFLKTLNYPPSDNFASKSKSFGIKSFQDCTQLPPSVRDQNSKKGQNPYTLVYTILCVTCHTLTERDKFFFKESDCSKHKNKNNCVS